MYEELQTESMMAAIRGGTLLFTASSTSNLGTQPVMYFKSHSPQPRYWSCLWRDDSEPWHKETSSISCGTYIPWESLSESFKEVARRRWRSRPNTIIPLPPINRFKLISGGDSDESSASDPYFIPINLGFYAAIEAGTLWVRGFDTTVYILYGDGGVCRYYVKLDDASPKWERASLTDIGHYEKSWSSLSNAMKTKALEQYRLRPLLLLDSDIHTATANAIFGSETPTAEERNAARIANFSAIYGGTNRIGREGVGMYTPQASAPTLSSVYSVAPPPAPSGWYGSYRAVLDASTNTGRFSDSTLDQQYDTDALRERVRNYLSRLGPLGITTGSVLHDEIEMDVNSEHSLRFINNLEAGEEVPAPNTEPTILPSRAPETVQTPPMDEYLEDDQRRALMYAFHPNIEYPTGVRIALQSLYPGMPSRDICRRISRLDSSELARVVRVVEDRIHVNLVSTLLE